jgi:hypothetical protein
LKIPHVIGAIVQSGRWISICFEPQNRSPSGTLQLIRRVRNPVGRPALTEPQVLWKLPPSGHSAHLPSATWA